MRNRLQLFFLNKVNKNGPVPAHRPELGSCWLWLGSISPKGYGKCGVKQYGEQQAHRASWRLHNGNVPNGVYVLHHCDVRNCVNPGHLYTGTQADNMRDCFERTRPPRKGESNGRAKLSVEGVRTIRDLLEKGFLRQRWIAAIFGVSEGTVGFVKTGSTWVSP